MFYYFCYFVCLFFYLSCLQCRVLIESINNTTFIITLPYVRTYYIAMLISFLSLFFFKKKYDDIYFYSISEIKVNYVLRHVMLCYIMSVMSRRGGKQN